MKGTNILEGEASAGSTDNNNLRPSSSEISNLKDLLKKTTDTADQRASQIAELQKQKEDLEWQLSETTSPPQLASSHLEHVFDQKNTGNFASGMQFVDRDDFAKVFDTGVPLDDSKEGNDRVILLYSDPKAFPATKRKAPLLSAEEATSNCLNLHVVLTHDRKQQCIAIMGQYESFHIHKYMRVAGEKGKIDPDLPLKYTDRGHQQNGRISAKIPSFEATQEHWQNLISYLQSIDKALDELKPILEKVASHNPNNAVVVMVCNFGQSELLLNCTCASIDRSINYSFRIQCFVFVFFIGCSLTRPLYINFIPTNMLALLTMNTLTLTHTCTHIHKHSYLQRSCQGFGKRPFEHLALCDGPVDPRIGNIPGDHLGLHRLHLCGHAGKCCTQIR